MKLLPRLVIVLVVCLIAIALPAAPAQAQCGLPYIDVSPGSGAPGTLATVYGERFDAGKYVDIYYDGTITATGRTDVSGRLTIAFTVPEGYKGAYLVHAKVGAEVGYDTADAYFAVTPGLTVSPERGSVGTNVTVKGQGFAQNEEAIELMYYLNGDYETIDRHITADARGSWEISFPIPPSARGEHKLDADGAVSELYEVQDAVFRVTGQLSMDKSSGFVGERVTMTGGKFGPYEKGIQILFDGEAVATDIEADDRGEWEASFQVPEMPTGEYSVTAEGEQTRQEDIIGLSFEIKPDIVLFPTEGHVGMDVTVTGQGFAASEDVNITYDGSQMTTADTGDQGSFEASFIVPESQHGQHQVTAGYFAGNAARATFVMESDRPNIPELISPRDRSWVGPETKVTPTFEWSAVSDESGVRYSLQIAASANVTASGEFVDPIVSVTGIIGTSHTVDKTEALPNGTYYWIVQAVDRAENESSWTAPHSFRAGLLPLWAFILIIVGAVVLLGALIYFLVARRRRYYYE